MTPEEGTQSCCWRVVVAVLLASELEEGATSQGIQVASKSWNVQKEHSSADTSISAQ